jgi:nucleoid DNA-binding protein
MVKILLQLYEAQDLSLGQLKDVLIKGKLKQREGLLITHERSFYTLFRDYGLDRKVQRLILDEILAREQLIRKLSSETGYYQKDIRGLLDAMSTVVLECFDEVAEGDDVSVQLFEGCRIGCKVMQERERIHPKTREAIICKPTIKPFCKFSEGFRTTIQEQYDKKMDT